MLRDEIADALVVVDMQVDFFEDSELADSKAKLVSACNELSSRARRAGVPIFEVRTLHAHDRSTWSRNMLQDGAGVVIEGTPGAHPLPELRTQGAIVVSKTRDSAFYETPLDGLLRERGVGIFALCGVSTESCIAVTASEAYARDFGVLLVDGATASIDPEQHRRTLSLLTEQYRQPIVAPNDVTFGLGDDHAARSVRG